MTLESYGQSAFELNHISTLNHLEIYDTLFYSQTDFSFIDNLDLWNYKLDTSFIGHDSDSIKAKGQLIFWRTEPIDDGISKDIYGQLWTPYITFDIYSLSDSIYCLNKSLRTRIVSSCVAPDVGGDLIEIGNFLLLNHAVCLSCQRYDTKKDYCRPVLKVVFSKLDNNKIITIESLVEQFIISKGELQKREERKVFTNE